MIWIFVASDKRRRKRNERKKRRRSGNDENWGSSCSNSKKHSRRGNGGNSPSLVRRRRERKRKPWKRFDSRSPKIEPTEVLVITLPRLVKRNGVGLLRALKSNCSKREHQLHEVRLLDFNSASLMGPHGRNSSIPM